MSTTRAVTAAIGTPGREIRAAAGKLREHIKHAADSPWVTSTVWSPRSASTSAVYSHAYPTGSVASEVVASGRIKHGYGGIRSPWNAEYIALMQPAVGAALANWLDWTVGYFNDDELPSDALALARLINGTEDGAA